MVRRFVLSVWPVVLLAVLMGAAGGYVFALGGHSNVARVTLYVAPPASSSPTDAVMGDQYAANRTQLYLLLAQSNELAQRVAGQLGSREAPAALADRITVSGSHDTPLLMIDATGSTPEEARTLAGAYKDQFPDYARAVERGSGLREGPVVIPVAGPVDIGDPIGWKSWLPVILPALVCGALALAFTTWYGRRHPRARDVVALRKAMRGSFVEPVPWDAASLARVRAILFTGPHAARTVLLASARSNVGLEAFTDALSDDLRRADIYYQHTSAEQAGELKKSLHSREIVLVDAPGMLDETHEIAALAGVTDTAVIVADRRRTLIEDVVELARLLDLNGITVKAVLIVSRRGAPTHGKIRTDQPGSGETGATPAGANPWPRIDVLEDAGTSAGMSGQVP